ncbi:hypothetical Protein YC6258_01343 [Gynuella sunshinyii YC6258]|uniref:Transposase DDE domain-containing protein n=1 Tax=Gynuella sunshinyii YC6258 TaxID=1445510 RepID=A0A0C5VGQ1_9GAMM|nr:hypothetical Protein YC6258_01343 [Gynuella sunshinyii YC6258]
MTSSVWVRAVVTSLKGEAQGYAEQNRIKEQKLLFSTRTSCHEWWPNQFRLLLTGFAYTLMERLRALALQNTELAQAQADTIRHKLFKIGAVITRNTGRFESSPVAFVCQMAEKWLNLHHVNFRHGLVLTEADESSNPHAVGLSRIGKALAANE